MANAFPSVRFVFDRKHQATTYKIKDKKKGLVQLEVIYKRERKWFGTGIKLYLGQWDEHLHVVDHPDATELNSTLASIGSKAARIIAEMARNDEEPFSIAKFSVLFEDNAYCGNGSRPVDEVVDEMIEEGEMNGLKKSTISGYKAMFESVRKFRLIKYMKDINADTLAKYEMFLHNAGLKKSTSYAYMQMLSKLVRHEMSRHRMSYNPFDEYKLSKNRTRCLSVRSLTDDEMDKVEAFCTDDKSLQKARDIFLIQRYTGMSHCDLAKIDLYKDFSVEAGKYVLRSDRQKTGVGFTVVLLEPAVLLLERYGGRIPIKSISRLDSLLHTVGLLTIGRKITSHDGRHSFATWALRHGVRIEYISKILGHTNTKQTMRYANVMDDDVKESFETLGRVIDSNSKEEVSIAACECTNSIEADVRPGREFIVDDESVFGEEVIALPDGTVTEEQYYSGELDVDMYI